MKSPSYGIRSLQVVRTAAAALALLALVGTAGCSSSDEPPRNDAGAEDDAGAVPVPASPAGTQLRWLLKLLNGPATDITEARMTEHFAQEMLQQLPPSALAEILSGLAAEHAPVELRAIEASSPGSLLSGARVLAIVETSTKLFVRVTLQVSAGGGDARIAGLSFSPAPEHDVALNDAAALSARLPSVAPRSGLLISRLEAGACVTLSEWRSDEPMPIGSLFKLYVLGALAAKIQEGAAAWSDLVTIDDGLKSFPSGVLQDQPNGAQVSVEEMANKMISISDNTGADHLIHLVGREAIEAYQVSMGHSNPMLNIPFLTTRELFLLKLSATAAEREAFLSTDPDGRRHLLDTDYALRPLPPLEAAAAVTAPVEIERLEWFASPADICRAFVTLEQMAREPEGAPVLEILGTSPGFPVDRKTFSYAGYKGGSEPGVLTFAWLLRRATDGEWAVVTLGFADNEHDIDEFSASYYALAALQIAGR